MSCHDVTAVASLAQEQEREHVFLRRRVECPCGVLGLSGDFSTFPLQI